jgi:hypothetical protein
MRHAACLPAALPQCPQAIDPAAKAFPGAPVNSWSYTNCSATYCAGAARQHVLCNRTRLPPMPAAQGLGACPAVKYLPGDGYYYVIFAGAPFVYLIRTRDFVTCVAFRFCLPVGPFCLEILSFPYSVLSPILCVQVGTAATSFHPAIHRRQSDFPVCREPSNNDEARPKLVAAA